jgi:osmotically-inducible protein OsmY
LDHLLPRFVERARGRHLRELEGPYAGMGPEGYHPNDERILEEVNDRLMQHGWLDARAVRVQVEDGHVTLSGRVDSRRARQMAAETAASVLGVRGVENDLQIRR